MSEFAAKVNPQFAERKKLSPGERKGLTEGCAMG